MKVIPTIKYFRGLQFNDFVAIVFILLFSYVGISKLLDFQEFSESLAKSSIFQAAPMFYAILIPLTELFVAGLLITTRYRKPATIITFILMVAFTYYVAQILGRNWGTPCTCGGIISWLSWRQHLYLNIFLSCLSMLGILFPYKFNNEIQSKPNSTVLQ